MPPHTEWYALRGGELRPAPRIDPGPLVHRDEEGFVRVKARSMRFARWAFGLFLSLGMLFLGFALAGFPRETELVFPLVISLLFFAVAASRLREWHVWRFVERGSSVHEGGLCLLQVGANIKWHYLPFEEVDRIEKGGRLVLLRMKHTHRTWTFTIDEIGDVGYAELTRWHLGEGKRQGPPELVVYPLAGRRLREPMDL